MESRPALSQSEHVSSPFITHGAAEGSPLPDALEAAEDSPWWEALDVEAEDSPW